MNAATLDDLRWLTSSAAAPWLQRADELCDSPLVCAAQLRRELSAARAALVQEQAQLRRRAARKFSAAGAMYFTARGLEQATDETIAGYKAGRFAAGEPIADLCCGIGGDLLALSSRGPTAGVDRDEATTLFAAANVATTRGAAPDSPSNVQCGDACGFDLAQVAAWHIDPDRRPSGKRTTRATAHEPSDAAIDALRRANGSAAIKLAPAAEIPPHWQAEAELEWIGHDRQCQQLVAWFGRLASRPGQRTATSLESDGPISFFGSWEAHADVAERIGRFVHEPHAAVLAAGLWGDLAVRHGLASIAPRIPYLTADDAVDDPLLAAFEILELLPLQEKLLKPALRARGVGTLEIKKRGVAIEPEKLRRRLALAGDESLSLIATIHAGKNLAILARRVQSK